MDITRRNLLETAGVAVAGTAIAGAAGASSAQADESQTGDYDYSCDLVIVGSGMGGMCAALQALDDGLQNVMVVEISKWTGGGTALSVGAIHALFSGPTTDTYDAFTQYLATDDLSHEVYEGLIPLVRWLRDDHGLPVLEATYEADTPIGWMLTEDEMAGVGSPRYFFDRIVEEFESRGGTLLMETQATHLITDENHQVIGLQCADKDGGVIRIAADGVVLACGGYQGDSEMAAMYLGGPDHWTGGVMGTPYNTGAGIKMAAEVGASLQGNFNQWAGCFVPAQPARHWTLDQQAWESVGFSQEEFGIYWMYMNIIDSLDARSIWVNNDGRRFVDENLPGLSARPYAYRQPHAAAIIVSDATTWNEWMASAATQGFGATTQDVMDVVTSQTVGGRIFSADTLEDLADQLNAAGPATYKVHKATFLKTIEEYNDAAQAGTGADLVPPRADAATCVPIVEPPFYAVPVQPAPYATFGGLAIDENARVLDSTRRPIRGLYACFPTAGGVIHEVYSGSINAAGVTGRLAGAAAAAEILGTGEPFDVIALPAEDAGAVADSTKDAE